MLGGPNMLGKHGRVAHQNSAALKVNPAHLFLHFKKIGHLRPATLGTSPSIVIRRNHLKTSCMIILPKNRPGKR